MVQQTSLIPSALHSLSRNAESDEWGKQLKEMRSREWVYPKGVRKGAVNRLHTITESSVEERSKAAADFLAITRSQSDWPIGNPTEPG
jgi:hypothetical protein